VKAIAVGAKAVAQAAAPVNTVATRMLRLFVAFLILEFIIRPSSGHSR
jgi:hypothetical protein